MKKVLALLLSLALITPSTVSALSTNSLEAQTALSSAANSSKNHIIYNSSASNNLSFTAKKGDTITVYAKIQNAPSASGYFGALNYDNSALFYKGFSSTFNDTYSNMPYGGYVLFNILFGEKGTDLTSETTVATFTFTVRKDISESDKIISYTVKEFYDTNLVEFNYDKTVKYEVTNGVIDEPHTHTAVTDPAVAPTCTETGLTEGSHCSECGEVIVPQAVINAKGHTTVIDNAVSPTCTQSGLTEGAHCSDCGKVLTAQQVISPNGHSYNNGICSVCGEKDPNYTPPIDGIYGDVSGDGRVTALDAYALLRNIAGLSELDDAGIAAADVDGDGRIRTIDAIEIQRYAADYPVTSRVGQEI